MCVDFIFMRVGISSEELSLFSVTCGTDSPRAVMLVNDLGTGVGTGIAEGDEAGMLDEEAVVSSSVEGMGSRSTNIPCRTSPIPNGGQSESLAVLVTYVSILVASRTCARAARTQDSVPRRNPDHRRHRRFTRFSTHNSCQSQPFETMNSTIVFLLARIARRTVALAPISTNASVASMFRFM